MNEVYAGMKIFPSEKSTDHARLGAAVHDRINESEAFISVAHLFHDKQTGIKNATGKFVWAEDKTGSRFILGVISRIYLGLGFDLSIITPSPNLSIPIKCKTKTLDGPLGLQYLSSIDKFKISYSKLKYSIENTHTKGLFKGYCSKRIKKNGQEFYFQSLARFIPQTPTTQGNWVESGESGTLILDNNKSIIGMVIAKDSKFTYANPSTHLESFQISF